MSYLFSCDEPWTIDVNDIMHKGEVIAEVFGDDADQKEANARLIAAAPDLYRRLAGLCFVINSIRSLDENGEHEAAMNMVKQLTVDAKEARNFMRGIGATLVDYHYNECFGGTECEEKSG